MREGGDMNFLWPLGLLALLLVPLVALAYLLIDRRPSKYALAFPNLEVLAGVVDRSDRWRRLIPPALFLLALVAAGLALARPERNVMVDREQATVVLAVDTSGSMLAEDIKPSRLEAAQASIRTFLDKLPSKFRVGMVAFAEEAQVVAPVTTNRQGARDAVDYLFPMRGTAIGDAVARAAELAQEATGEQPETQISGFDFGLAAAQDDSEDGSRPPAAVLLLSDGFQTAGLLPPLDGAARAKELGIPVYTIALGTADGVVDLSFGGEARRIPVPPDRETLRLIARETGGRYFNAPSAKALESAYSELGSLLAREPGKDEATHLFALAAAIFGLSAAVLSALWFSRIP
jgi:Ca-activated chloride channel family protein